MGERSRGKRTRKKLKRLIEIRDEKIRNGHNHSKEDRAICRLNKTLRQIRKDELGRKLGGQRYSREHDKATRRNELKKSDENK